MLPGTGSDDDYIARAFGGPLRDAGARLLAPPPQPRRLIDGYRNDLDDAAREGPIVVGGVSIGAAVAVAWALDHPERVHCGVGRAAGLDWPTRRLACRDRGRVHGAATA